ncbi:MAG TPA: hypothetical protein VII03_02055, partial [Solirubrobacteraceae bacterium]
MRKSLPLEVAMVRHIAEDFGVTIASSFVKGSPVECGLLVRRICEVEGVARGEYVTVSVGQPEVRNLKRRTPRNRRTYQRSVVIPGTEVEVSV